MLWERSHRCEVVPIDGFLAQKIVYGKIENPARLFSDFNTEDCCVWCRSCFFGKSMFARAGSSDGMKSGLSSCMESAPISWYFVHFAKVFLVLREKKISIYDDFFKMPIARNFFKIHLMPIQVSLGISFLERVDCALSAFGLIDALSAARASLPVRSRICCFLITTVGGLSSCAARKSMLNAASHRADESNTL